MTSDSKHNYWESQYFFIDNQCVFSISISQNISLIRKVNCGDTLGKVTDTTQVSSGISTLVLPRFT